MRILVACEHTQAVCTAFRSYGHEAYSCDLLSCSGLHPEWHLQCDVLTVLDDGWDMVIAFPPCTDLCVSGSKWFKDKKLSGRQSVAVDFFMRFVACKVSFLCIENPVGIMSSLYRKPDQIVHPNHFGDPYRKSTCLWLRNLPFLIGTDYVSGGSVSSYGSGKRINTWYSNLGKKDRGLIRSRTFPGIAAAMASQWSLSSSCSPSSSLLFLHDSNFVSQKGLCYE